MAVAPCFASSNLASNDPHVVSCSGALRAGIYPSSTVFQYSVVFFFVLFF